MSSLGQAQEIGGVVVTIGGNLAPLRAAVAEAKHVAGGADTAAIGAGFVNSGASIGSPNMGTMAGGGFAGLFGPNSSTTSSRQSGENHGKAFGEGFVSKLNESVGKNSEAGHLLHILEGGGAVFALGMGGRFLAESSESLNKGVNQLVAGRMSAGQAAENFMGGLPVIGGFWQTGRNIQQAMLAFSDQSDEQIQDRANVQLSHAQARRGVMKKYGQDVAGLRESRWDAQAVSGGSFGAIEARQAAENYKFNEDMQSSRLPWWDKAELRRNHEIIQDEEKAAPNRSYLASRAGWGRAAGLYEDVITAEGNQAMRGAQIANINGTQAGLAGTSGSRLAVEELQFKNEQSEIQSRQVSSAASINDTFEGRKLQIKNLYGEDTDTSKREIGNAQRLRDDNLKALEMNTEAMRTEAGARHATARAEILNADDNYKTQTIIGLGTRRQVAGAVGQGFNVLAGVRGRIGGMASEMYAQQHGPHPELAGALGDTQAAELRGFLASINRPTHYATELNRGMESPGGPSGQDKGSELLEIGKVIRDYLATIKQYLAPNS